MLNPFSVPDIPRIPGSGGQNPGGIAGTALETTGMTLDQIGNFAWLSVILVLFFPRMRDPLVGLWTAIFGALSIPFLALRKWYENRSNVK